MPAPIVRSNYEHLDQIARLFDQESQTIDQLVQQVAQCQQTLEAGGWKGKAASQFFNEMNTSVTPSVRRLKMALDQAGRVTVRIRARIQQAESDAARVLDGRGVEQGTAGTDGGGAGPGGAPDGASGAGQSGQGTTPDWKQQNPLLVRDPKSLFNDDNFLRLNQAHYPGEGTPELRQVMNDLYQNPTGAKLDDALQRLSAITGKPVEQLRGDYEKYQQLLAQQAQNGYEREALKQSPDWKDAVTTAVNPLIGLGKTTLSTHPDFMGSNGQLRYGDMVGQAFGIDPVFGALLNPSGGLVGPGNNAVDAGQSALALHGQVHDAAGYLYNAHNKVGPGYDYLGLEGRDTASPLSGQRAGIRHMGELTGDNGTVTRGSARVMDGVVEAVDNPTRILKRAIDPWGLVF
jgi:WXG100 family type VII secretion target